MARLQEMARGTRDRIEARIVHAIDLVNRFLWRNSRLLRPRPRLSRVRVVSTRH